MGWDETAWMVLGYICTMIFINVDSGCLRLAEEQRIKREPGKHFMVIRVILEWSRCVCAQDLQLGTSYAFISICKTLCLEKNITITVNQTTCKARTSRLTLLQENLFLPLTAEEFHCKQTFIHTNTKVSNTIVSVWWAMLDLLCYCDLKMPMCKSICIYID